MAGFLHLPSFQYNEDDYNPTMLLNQRESQPEKKSPTDKFPPNLIRRGHQMIPSRPESFTTSTFHSNPHYRTIETFTLFDTGPAFSGTRQFYELCNLEQTNSYKVQLDSKLDRGFFKADEKWTCYRRNYFQVSATFGLQGTHYPLQGIETPCWLLKDDEKMVVDHFSIGIHALVVNHDKRIELVQHTAKRDKGPQVVPQPLSIRAGGNLNLIGMGPNSDDVATFERLQFKTATANNGKRQSQQQFYEIVIDLFANTHNQKAIRVATICSVPLVVRGRSPGHYADSHTRFRASKRSVSLPNSPPIYSPYLGSSQLYGPSYSNNLQYNTPFIRDKVEKQNDWVHPLYYGN